MTVSANVGQDRLLTIVWLALGAVTLASWWIGSSHGRDEITRNVLITYGVVLIGAIKVRVIVSQFMEMKHGPILWRRLMDAWLACLVVALLAIYSLRLSMPPV